MQIDIPRKKCPICNKPLTCHVIPKEALKRFIESKESIYEDPILGRDNVVKRYEKSLSQTSKAGSIKNLMRFCWTTHLTPKQLIALAYKDKRIVEKLCDDWEDYVLEKYENPTLDFGNQALNKHTCVHIAKSVKGFFKRNKLSLSDVTFSRIFDFKARIPRKRTYVPTKKDIRTFWNMALPRDKLLIQFGVNVPLRREEMCGQLHTGQWALTGVTWEKLGDLTKPHPMLIFEDWELKGQGKDQYEGCLFIGFLSESVRKGLIERKKQEQERFRLTKDEWEDKGYTFISEFTEKTKVFLSSQRRINEKEKTVSINPLGYHAIGNVMMRNQRRCGIPLHFHCFRNFFQDMLNVYSRKNTEAREIGQEDYSVFENVLVGHKIQGTKRIYSNPEKYGDEILKVWKQVEPYIDLEFPEKTKEQLVKSKFKELREKYIKEGKESEEASDLAFEVVLKEQRMMLLKDMDSLKDTMKEALVEADKKYRRKTTE